MSSSLLGMKESGSAGTKNSTKDVWDKSKTAFTQKRSSEFFDPCQEFANRSVRCMHRNAGDKDMCQDYFQAYRDCKKEWTTRRRTGRGADSWQTENTTTTKTTTAAVTESK